MSIQAVRTFYRCAGFFQVRPLAIGNNACRPAARSVETQTWRRSAMSLSRIFRLLSPVRDPVGPKPADVPICVCLLCISVADRKELKKRIRPGYAFWHQEAEIACKIGPGLIFYWL